jgi:hypothetical protein
MQFICTAYLYSWPRRREIITISPPSQSGFRFRAREFLSDRPLDTPQPCSVGGLATELLESTQSFRAYFDESYEPATEVSARDSVERAKTAQAVRKSNSCDASLHSDGY